jgi:hypothetical protein
MKRILKSFPPLRWFLDIRRELSLIRFQVSRQTRIQQQIFREILTQRNDRLGKHFPSIHEHQTYSQNGEDGIIHEIFSRIGIEKGTFVEIGTGDGSENNTRLLLDLGWKGTWIEGDASSCETARENLKEFTETGCLKIINTHVTPQNINDILQRENIPQNIDLLSLDIDMDTHHVWKTLDYLNANIAVVEYNGFFPESVTWESEYEEGGSWDGTINMGATLKSLIEIASSKELCHIGCELTGTNAFFARTQLVKEHFPEVKAENNLFEPSRHFLVNDPEHKK